MNKEIHTIPAQLVNVNRGARFVYGDDVCVLIDYEYPRKQGFATCIKEQTYNAFKGTAAKMTTEFKTNNCFPLSLEQPIYKIVEQK